MSHHSRSSDPVDPLLNYTLFNTKLSSSDPSKPFDFDRDLQAINNHLKSTVPLDGLKDQARNILSGTSGLKKSGMSRALERLKVHVPVNAVEDNRERRPGLGRKRAHFSMKPNSSQPEKSLKPTFESKRFKDPVEYFKAYERHENATREMEKLSGTVMDADQQNLSLIIRARRPGLSRKPAKYKHLYSPAENKIYEDTLSSQEVFETSPPNSVKPSSQTESHANFASEMDLGGSKVNEDNKTNDTLHNLLSQDTEVLENDGAKRLLEEYLHIKTFEVEDICLPDFSDTWKVDLKSSRRPLLKPGSVKSRHAAEGSIHLASPMPPKSPLASLSLLSKRRSLQSSSIELQSSSSDPFSACHIDQLPAEDRNKNCDLIDMSEKSKFSVELEAPSNKQIDKTEGAKAGSPEVVIDEYTQVLEQSKSDSLSKMFVGSNVDMEEENRGSKVVNEALSKPYDSNTEADEFSISDKAEHKLQGALPETNATESTLEELNSAESQVADDDIVNDERQEEKRQETMPEHNVIDAHLKKLNIAQSQPVDIVMNFDEVQDQDKQQQPVASTEHGLNVADSSVERLHNPLSQLDQLHSVPLEENPSNGLSNPVIGPEKQNEIMQEHSGVSLNKPIEADPRSRKKQKHKVLSKRQSLAAHGTSWKSGVRRSTRIKTRPLEFWKGERLLYGRVHDSLPTVIGMKYASPGKGEHRASLKVKSFVSDKHKLLVDLVSLH